ncbi:MAG: division/cell wall cluster transcriptional repressor MraZ [Candidatus Kerfeldbacteria bacterium]|nr:division/cell wall cluster transcriptional repressor MraZ [Candidatus Kerfeldbacteria bacterium]
MFIGEYQHNLDEKGRLALPVKFREAFGHGAVVTRGLDHCLFVYSTEEWAKLADKLATLPIAQANTRAFARLMLAGAMDCALDKQGRVVLPEYLREYASIKKAVVVAGLYNRLEIWEEAAWKKYKTATEKESNTIAEALGQLGV